VANTTTRKRAAVTLPPPVATPDEAITRERAKRPAYNRRQFSLSQLTSNLVLSGHVENPDEIIKTFGGAEGLKIYFRMMRQFAFLGGPISQRIDPVIAIERNIVPGDGNVDLSVQMAEDARRWWQSVRNKEIIQRKLLLAQFVGFYPIEKVFGTHEATGLLAPIGENGRGDGLFDVPPQNVRFTKEGAPLIFTDRLYRGMPVEPRKLFFGTWGTTSTPYGEGELKDVYLATWYMQIITDLAMKAVEQLGRPIPVVFVPRATTTAPEMDEIEESVADQFDFYLTLPTDEAITRVDFPNISVAAGGAAGRAEQEWLRYLETWVWNRLLNTSQTQDRGGQGNGKLEETRREVKHPKIAIASDALDDWLTEGCLEDIGELNWPNQPRELWPRFKSDTTEVSSEGLTGIAAATADKQLLRLVARQITETQAEEILTGLGFPRSRAAKMVAAAVEARNRGELVVAPEVLGNVQAAPTANNEKEEEEAA
jgi:hypothetical protein